MHPTRARILIIDDDRSFQLATKQLLRQEYECVSAYTGDEALAILQNQRFDLVLLDMHLTRKLDGLSLIPRIKRLDSDLEIVVVSGNSDIEPAVQAIQLGAYAYLLKDHSVEQLRITVESVLRKNHLAHENKHHVQERKRQLARQRILGDSPAIRALLRDLEKVRRSRANVIIYGETGCGKELVARHAGAVDGTPFVAIDSSTITSSMAESILFGHERGSFTGAQAQSRGLFEEANGGTIYFDEIANMPLEIQAKILRVLQEKEIVRLGSAKTIPLDFRVICATNRDLEKLSEQGLFKADLYQRLNVIELRIPPLRERTEDIPLLLAHFLKEHRQPGAPESFSPDALQALCRYRWPGNIRELSNLVANLCTMLTGQTEIHTEDLPAKIQAPSPVVAPVNAAIGGSRSPASFYETMHQLEGQVLSGLYSRYAGNLSEMSRKLKISRSHLYAKLRDHALHVGKEES